MDFFGTPDIDKMAEQQDFDGLYKCLEHRDRVVRLQAAQALADLNDDAGWRFLADAARQENDLDTRILAVTMMGELGQPRAVPVLGEILQKMRFSTVSLELSQALQSALETIDTEEARDALRKAGYEPILPIQHHTLIEYDAHYVRPVLHSSTGISFHTPEQHLDTAVELREAEQAERALVEDSLAIWLKPDWAYAWYLRGVIFEDLDRNFEATLAYRRALRLDPALTEPQEALADLDDSGESNAMDFAEFALDPGGMNFPLRQQTPDLVRELIENMAGRSWQERRDAAAAAGELALPRGKGAAAAAGELALQGDPRAAELVEALVLRVQDEEREVRHAAIEALGRIGNPSAVEMLLKLEDSSWLVRFAIIQALSGMHSVAGLTSVLRSEMNRIQERNPVFSSNKDPLLEVEYESLMEIGVLALERTGDIAGLLSIAEGSAWEEQGEGGEPAVEASGGENYYDLGIPEPVVEEEDGEEDEEEVDDDLTSYVDEVAEMVDVGLERLAPGLLGDVQPDLLERLAAVPDLTLMDLNDENAEPAIVHDLSALRAAAQDEINRRESKG
jgi:HEAT repeat protein